jgi:predicted nucleic acid-binding protein
MSSPRRIVLDANILLRALFGKRVRGILKSYEDSVEFYAPDVCLADARKYVPSVAARREVDPALPESVLNDLFRGLIQVVDCGLYEEFEEQGRARISSRDVDDWPVVATALLLGAPIWTEDRDFFGSGIATWTSNKVELYLRDG